VHGSNVKSSKEALRLTRIYPGIIYSTAGIHPHDSKNVVEDMSCWPEFETIAKQPECCAIGPAGLDYNRDISDPETQKEIFKKQIQLAVDLQKPLLIHEKGSQDNVLEILSR
jgi:TatD DNase family protein